MDSSDSEGQFEYDATLLGHAVPTERQRLDILEALFDPITIPILTSREVGPDQRCLELGAGAGSIARWMAEQGAQVVATDTDTRFLEASANLQVLQHNVVNDGFPAGSFDLIHARLLLEHLPQRDAVLTKAAGWLAPGGWLVIEDASDFAAKASPYPAMRRLWEAVLSYLAKAVGTDPTWAPRLPMLLAAAGLVDLGMSVTVLVNDGGPATNFIRATAAQLGQAIVADGQLTAAEFAATLAMFDDPSYIDLSTAVVSAWGRRPW